MINIRICSFVLKLLIPCVMLFKTLAIYIYIHSHILEIHTYSGRCLMKVLRMPNKCAVHS